MERFCVLDDEVCTMFVVDNLAEARFDLFRHIEIVEDGHYACVSFHNFGLFRGNECNVLSYFVIDFFVVDVDVFVRGVEEVAQQSHHSACFFIYQLGTLFGLLYFNDGVFPSFEQYFHFSIQFGHSFSFGYCTYDDAEVFWPYAVDELFESCSLFSALDLGRY